MGCYYKVYFSLEAPCPKNYNPADYFIQLLAIVPGQEESCRQAINLICNQYEKSETGAKTLFEALSTVCNKMKSKSGHFLI